MVNGEYKNIMKRIVMILMAVALIALPTMAQQDQWQSTSSLPTSGSSYTPQVTPVGSPAPVQQSPAGAPYTPEITDGPNRGFINPGEGGSQSDQSPLGDGLIPLTLLALAYGAVVYFRRRKETLNG